MSTGEMAYLGMVLAAFFIFIGVVGFVSTWSRKAPSSADQRQDWDRGAERDSTHRHAA